MSDLHVHADDATLVREAAAWLLTRVEEAQRDGRPVHVALTGGSLVPSFHAEVANQASERRIDLTRVHWWWGDERFVPGESEERNDLSGLRDLLEPLGVPPEQIHRVASSDEVASVEAAAEDYTAQLRDHAVEEFEVVVLGVGPDGHLASLFPGHPQVGISDEGAVAVHDSPKPPPLRVSLTMPTLQRNRAVLFLASGEGKAEAIATARTPGPVEECPARGVRGGVETAWFLDRHAASRLTQ